MKPNRKFYSAVPALVLAAIGLLFAVHPAVAQVENGIIFIDSYDHRIQQINLSGTDETSLIGALPMQEVVYEPGEGKLYGTAADDAVRRMNPDGSGVETLITGLDNPTGLQLDTTNDKMYWIDANDTEIRRAHLDGSDMQTVVPSSEVSEVGGIVLDVANGKLYWVDVDDAIQRSNLDGSNIETLQTPDGGTNPELGCLALDTVNGYLYWVQDGGSSDNFIGRANLDGSDPQQIVVLDNFPDISCPTLDVDGGVMYWGDSDAEVINRANLDGSDVNDILTDLRIPGQVLLGGNDKIYWLEQDANFSFVIMRANTDGSNPEVWLDSDFSRLDMWLIPSEGLLYWIDANALLERVNLDGSDLETLFLAARDPRGLALDRDAAQLYWTDQDNVYRTDLATMESKTLVTGQNATGALTLDLAIGKMYWADNGLDKILRANLDGSQVEDVYVAPDEGLATSMDGLAVDSAAGDFYWSYSIFQGGGIYEGGIMRANLDGSNPVPVVTGLQIPRGIALDLTGGKIYWADSYSKKIQRANLDGSQVEDLVTTGLDFPHGLSIDTANGHLYWADFGLGVIKRADLDGGNVVERYGGPSTPYRLIVTAPTNGGEEPAASLFVPFLSK